MCSAIKLNTCNAGKQQEFSRLFEQYGIELETSAIDQAEIDASPEMVIAHKASQIGEGIWVEDTSLDVDGADVGVNVRWLLDHLSEYEGRSAQWVVMMGKREGDRVDIYRGVVRGKLTAARGTDGFGFDPVFVPEGHDHSLAQSKPDALNARALAVKAIATGKPWKSVPVIDRWDGPWQH